MTLVVALRHKTGVVLGSDSQATVGAGGLAMKSDTKKLDVLGGKLGIGCAGAQGLIQKATHQLEREQGIVNGSFKKGRFVGAEAIEKIVNPIQKMGRQTWVQVTNDPPPSMEALIAGFADGKPFIYEIAVNGAGQFHDVPFAEIGSGGALAHHAFRSVQHMRIEELDESRALMLAYRTVANAILSAEIGIGGNVQLLRVNDQGARLLSEAEVKGVQDSVEIWRAKEAATLFNYDVDEAVEAPEPPSEDVIEEIEDLTAPRAGRDAPPAS